MNTVQESTSTGQRYPIPNFLYDVITLIHERSKGIEALKEYQRDAQQGGHTSFVQLAQKMQQQDEQCVKDLMQILERNVKQQGQ